MCMTFMLAYLDKITLNFANAYSLQRDLGMTGNDYSWVAAITNIGYLAAALPANLALQKFPISKFLGISMAVWGSILTFTALAQNFAGLMALRFLLGTRRPLALHVSDVNKTSRCNRSLYSPSSNITHQHLLDSARSPF